VKNPEGYKGHEGDKNLKKKIKKEKKKKKNAKNNEKCKNQLDQKRTKITQPLWSKNHTTCQDKKIPQTLGTKRSRNLSGRKNHTTS
jgi:hypothetical protein